MLSLYAVIETPIAVDPARTIFRIDLRQYEWDRMIQLEGRTFGNVWDAIAEKNPFAVAFTGPEADAIAAATGTGVPIMFADQVLSVALVGQLYYAIVRWVPTEPLGAYLEDELEVELTARTLGERYTIRAATTVPGVPGQATHLVARDDVQVYDGVVWQSFELVNDPDPFALENLLGLPAVAGEAILTLGNGMFAFFLFDADGILVDASDVLMDRNLPGSKALSALSCLNCHSSGLLPVVDEARNYVNADGLDLALDTPGAEQFPYIYVTPDEFARTVQEDSANYYQRALRLAGLPETGPDPVVNLYLRFAGDLQLADAAGDLGITAGTLTQNLPQLSPVLSALARGTLGRVEFSAVFRDTLCILGASSANRPAGCNLPAAVGVP